GIARIRLVAFTALSTILILTGAVVHPHPAVAATYYVATNGNDSNPGTISSPYRTIIKGLSVMRAGDTLYIRVGVYADAPGASNALTTGTSCAGAPIVRSYPGETAELKSFGWNAVNKQYIILDGLVLNGSTGEGLYIQNGSGYLRATNCEIKNAATQG